MDCVTGIVKRVYIEVPPFGGIVKMVLRRDYYRLELKEYVCDRDGRPAGMWSVFVCTLVDKAKLLRYMIRNENY